MTTGLATTDTFLRLNIGGHPRIERLSLIEAAGHDEDGVYIMLQDNNGDAVAITVGNTLDEVIEQMGGYGESFAPPLTRSVRKATAIFGAAVQTFASAVGAYTGTLQAARELAEAACNTLLPIIGAKLMGAPRFEPLPEQPSEKAKRRRVVTGADVGGRV